MPRLRASSSIAARRPSSTSTHFIITEPMTIRTQMLAIPTLLSYITVRVPYRSGPMIAATLPKKPKKPKNSALRV